MHVVNLFQVTRLNTEQLGIGTSLMKRNCCLPTDRHPMKLLQGLYPIQPVNASIPRCPREDANQSTEKTHGDRAEPIALVLIASKSLLGILGCPLFGRFDSGLLIFLPVLSDIVCERIVRVRSAEEGLN